MSAMFLAMEARALASLADKSGTAAALNRAEQAFETRNLGADPEWVSYFDALELAGEGSHCFRDLGDGHRAKYFTAQAIDPVLTPPRTRAFIQTVSAAGSLANGERHEGVALATEAVELADGLQSMRYLRYLTDFCKALRSVKAERELSQNFDQLLKARYPKLALPPAA
ncbi:hypothetical protein GCM10017566_67630 [Amycolatopsis bartoniae]|uniref:Uncharacterized protein n=2 Tax=Amycolatopsis bartoniae TaxID=941986 RepID=A0A8H9J000_9PSEU|nr:hypothetical protein GCM10017566_67630 [Amycolatopsis bartoniae]